MIDEQKPLAEQLATFAIELMADVRDLRVGKISVTDARARAQLAREAMRAIHLQFEGMKWLEARAKQLPAPDPA